MNSQEKIREYYKESTRHYAELPDCMKGKISDYQISERVQRLGVEARYFGLGLRDQDSLLAIAVSTIRRNRVDTYNYLKTL